MEASCAVIGSGVQFGSAVAAQAQVIPHPETVTGRSDRTTAPASIHPGRLMTHSLRLFSAAQALRPDPPPRLPSSKNAAWRQSTQSALWAADLSPATLPGPEDRAPFPPTDRSILTPDRLSPTYSRLWPDRITSARIGRLARLCK